MWMEIRRWLTFRKSEPIIKEQGNDDLSADFNLQAIDEQDVENPENSNNIANKNWIFFYKIKKKTMNMNMMI